MCSKSIAYHCGGWSVSYSSLPSVTGSYIVAMVYMYASIVFTSSCKCYVHTLFIFFFDNVLHKHECVSCVCS